jgi:hypothetical protein
LLEEEEKTYLDVYPLVARILGNLRTLSIPVP